MLSNIMSRYSDVWLVSTGYVVITHNLLFTEYKVKNVAGSRSYKVKSEDHIFICGRNNTAIFKYPALHFTTKIRTVLQTPWPERRAVNFRLSLTQWLMEGWGPLAKNQPEPITGRWVYTVVPSIVVGACWYPQVSKVSMLHYKSCKHMVQKANIWCRKLWIHLSCVTLL